MGLPIYYVDAFAENLFQGNPAAVVILTESLETTIMQSIAFENNLSETAFVSVRSMPFSIRWFSPVVEVDLCGHATLASARILFDNHLPPDSSEVNFSAKRGSLRAFKKDDLIYLDFPAEKPSVNEQNAALARALGWAQNPSSCTKAKTIFWLSSRMRRRSMLSSQTSVYSPS